VNTCDYVICVVEEQQMKNMETQKLDTA